MSITRDQLPNPGDEVLCVVSDPNMPDMAWIEFMSGKRVEVRVWVEKPETD